jgi:hypothetical protein
MLERSFVVGGLALGLAFSSMGCASTRIVNQWSNPDHGSTRFARVLVIGVSKQPSLRRAFEDEFVSRLKAEGMDAVSSYRFLPEDGQVDEARLQEAVKQANADAVLVSRLFRVERKTDVSPGVYYPPPAMGLGFYGGYYGAWHGYYEPPRIYQYDIYVSETSLYDGGKNQLVWTATAQTEQPGDIDAEIKHYVDIVLKALKSRELLTFK